MGNGYGIGCEDWHTLARFILNNTFVVTAHRAAKFSCAGNEASEAFAENIPSNQTVQGGDDARL